MRLLGTRTAGVLNHFYYNSDTRMVETTDATGTEWTAQIIEGAGLGNYLSSQSGLTVDSISWRDIAFKIDPAE